MHMGVSGFRGAKGQELVILSGVFAYGRWFGARTHSSQGGFLSSSVSALGCGFNLGLGVGLDLGWVCATPGIPTMEN